MKELQHPENQEDQDKTEAAKKRQLGQLFNRKFYFFVHTFSLPWEKC
jgi:hypothetical protein